MPVPSKPRVPELFSRRVPVMIVSVTTARIPNFSTAAACFASTVSSTKTSTKSRYNSATPKADTRIPRLFIIRAAGPFNARPPTMGETAATRVFRSASRTPGTARIGPMLMIGFDGQMMTAAASPIACSNPGAGWAFFAPSKMSRPGQRPAPGAARSKSENRECPDASSPSFARDRRTSGRASIARPTLQPAPL